MNSIAMPNLAWRSLSSLRICACTVTSSAVDQLVGDQEIGPIGERHRDHHPLAFPTEELVEMADEPLGGVDDADLGQKLDDFLFRRRGAGMMEGDHLADLPLG